LKNISKLLGTYLGIENEDSVLLVDRAFLGLYSIFSLLKRLNAGEKVLFTSNTCASPVYACLYAGLTPVFSDISMDDYLMDYAKTERIIEIERGNLAAVVYIYTFGHTSDDILKIREVSHKYNIPVIEDVAQAFGASVGNQYAGRLADVSVFSFGYSKQIDAGGGGFVLLNNEIFFSIKDLSETLVNYNFSIPANGLSDEYRNHFYDDRKNALSDETQFSKYSDYHLRFRDLYFRKINPDWDLIERKLKSFFEDGQTYHRNARAQAYYFGLKNVCSESKLFLPEVRVGYSVYRYSVLVQNYVISTQLSEYLRKEKVNCSNLYIPVSRFFHNDNYNNAVDFSRRVINLWVDEIANDKYIALTISLFDKFFKSYKP
jgi:dTDP-4-amino-4,6-dideoxygalactose transaminase